MFGSAADAVERQHVASRVSYGRAMFGTSTAGVRPLFRAGTPPGGSGPCRRRFAARTGQVSSSSSAVSRDGSTRESKSGEPELMVAVVTILRMHTAETTVDGEDVRRAVALAIDTLSTADPRAWEGKAGTLEWTCWETLEHLADDLFTYAARFGLAKPPMSSVLPFRTSCDRSGGPANSIFVERAAGPGGLLTVLEACGGLLASVLRTSPSTTIAYHVFGPSGPVGFAAMAVVETLVHTHDIARGLNLAWSPPRELCERVLMLLFPHLTIDRDAWEILLWATGRTALPDRPQLTEWRWYGTQGV